MRIFNSLILSKNLKGILWDFLKFALLQNIKKNQTIENKSLKAEKRGESHSAEKVRTFCFGIFVKKISAYARVRTRNIWVER